jgi:hypothetical protein
MIGNWRNTEMEERVMIKLTRKDGFVIWWEYSNTHLLILDGLHLNGILIMEQELYQVYFYSLSLVLVGNGDNIPTEFYNTIASCWLQVKILKEWVADILVIITLSH